MNATLRLGIAILLGSTSTVTATNLEKYRWQNRPIILFADSPSAPLLRRQQQILKQNTAALHERDIVVLVEDTKSSALRSRFRPTGFTFILVGKDGGEKYRSQSPVSIATIREIIDAMPMRRREMKGG